MRLFSVGQRYEFESKSQRVVLCLLGGAVVFSRSKIRIWKQITTLFSELWSQMMLFSVGQRYEFESKSQLVAHNYHSSLCCFQSVKDTNLKANHNGRTTRKSERTVVFSRSKIRIWKQITTKSISERRNKKLFSVGQRYEFESKSQRSFLFSLYICSCFQSVKDTNLKANHN